MGPRVEDVSAFIAAQPGIDVVLDRKRGLRALRTAGRPHGRLIVVSGGPNATKVIGTSRDKHDLSGLNEPLALAWRAHASRTIPIIVNRKAAGLSGTLRNFDAFAIGCNHIAATAAAAE